MTNVSDNPLPYCPVEQNSLNLNNRAGNERAEGTCVICLDSTVNQIIVPCGHMCMCESCADTFSTDTYNDKKCPLCKGQIQNIIRVISS